MGTRAGRQADHAVADRLPPLNSPLWSWVLSKPQARDLQNLDHAQPVLLVAASRFLFQEHFRYDVYRNAIMANRMVPCDLKALLPERLERLDQLGYLVLEVKENITTEQGKRTTVPSYQAFRTVGRQLSHARADGDDRAAFDIRDPACCRRTPDGGDVHRDTRRRGRPADFSNSPGRDRSGPRGHSTVQQTRRLSRSGSANIGGDSETGTSGVDICKAALPDKGVRQIAADNIGSCERLRARLPLKYPRLVNNGQDLLICGGEHRLLRGREVAECAQAAGMKRLQGGERQFEGRLDVTTVQTPQAIEWLGPSRIAVPCGALSATDLEFAKALRSDRNRAAARINAKATTDTAPSPAGDQASEDVPRSDAKLTKRPIPSIRSRDRKRYLLSKAIRTLRSICRRAVPISPHSRRLAAPFGNTFVVGFRISPR